MNVIISMYMRLVIIVVINVFNAAFTLLTASRYSRAAELLASSMAALREAVVIPQQPAAAAAATAAAAAAAAEVSAT